MIKVKYDESVDLNKLVPAGARVGIIGCSDCASFYGAGDTKRIESVAASLEKGRRIAFRASLDSPCDQRLLKHLSKAVPGFFDADCYVVLACEAGQRSVGDFLASARKKSGGRPFEIVSPVGTVSFAIAAASRDVRACAFCPDCTFEDKKMFCPVALCPVGKKDGPCQNRKDAMCAVDPEAACSWIY